MLSTFLVQVPWLPAAALLVAVLAGPLAGMAIAQHRLVLRILLVVSLLLVASLTLYPEGRVVSDASCAVSVPYFSIGAVETLANVLLFIPVALLGSLLVRRPVLVVVACSALSASIELTQALVPAIGRACDTSDWMTNTLGAGLGGLIAVAALLLDRRRSHRLERQAQASKFMGRP